MKLVGDRRKQTRSQPINLEEMTTSAKSIQHQDSERKSKEDSPPYLTSLHEELCKTLFLLNQSPEKISIYATGR